MTIPESPEAECGILSCCLQNPNCIEDVGLMRDPRGLFFSPPRQLIWLALAGLRSLAKPINVITLTHALRDDGLLEAVGGPAELINLMRYAPSAAQISYYLDVAEVKRELRAAQAFLRTNLQAIEEGSYTNARAFLAALEVGASQLAGEPPEDDSIRAAVMSMMDQLQAAQLGKSRAVPFGIRKLDAMLGGGARPGQMVVIAARPSQGKTSVGWQQLVDAASEKAMPGGMFSMEMTREDLVRREICRRTKISVAVLSDGLMPLPLEERIAKGKEVTAEACRIADLPVRLDHRPSLHIDMIRATARRWKRRHDIAFVLIDYLQLAEADGENRTQEVTQISKGAKSMAKELDIPAIVLAQLNRAGTDKPAVHHLRESGAIEQDADVIILVAEDLECTDSKAECEPKKLIIGKNRNGATGEVAVWFHKPSMTFSYRVDLQNP